MTWMFAVVLLAVALGRFVAGSGTGWNATGLLVVALWSACAAARATGRGAHIGRICGAAGVGGSLAGVGLAAVSLYAATSRTLGRPGAPDGFYADVFLAARHSARSGGGFVVGAPEGPWHRVFGVALATSWPTPVVFVCAFVTAAAVGAALGVAWSRTGVRGLALCVLGGLLVAVAVRVLLEWAGAMPAAPWPGVVVLCPPATLAALCVAVVTRRRFGSRETRR